MEIFSDISSWISNNESFFSGVAALIVVVGFLFTIFKYFHSSISSPDNKDSKHKKKLTLQDLSAPSPYPINFANADGLRIAYTSIGSAAETLIICPGIVSNLHVASHLPPIKNTVDALSKFATVVNFDKRGQGLSDTTTGVAQLDERIKDVTAVADASNSEEFFLIGVSEGGPMSIKYAHENPEKVKGLILFGTAAKFVKSEEYPIGIAEKGMDSLANSWGKGLSRSIFFPGLDRDQIDDDVYMGVERLLADRDSVRQLIDYMKTLDVRDIASELQCPCLVIHFSGDMAIPVRLGRALAEAIPNSEFLEVAGIDHSDLAKSPEALKAVQTFVKEHA